MINLNLLNEAARHLLACVEDRLPTSMPGGDVHALLPPGPLREEARRWPWRFALMLERHGIAATLTAGAYDLRRLHHDAPGNPAEEATFQFWSLHQRLRQLDAPPDAFLSLNAHLWDLAWDGGGTTADWLLSHILLCWTPARIRESMQQRTPVYQPGDVPHYMHWLSRHLPPAGFALEGKTMVHLAVAIGQAMGEPTLENSTRAALEAVPAGRWRSVLPHVNGVCLETLDLAATFRNLGTPLPAPLDWDQAEPAQPALTRLRAKPGMAHIADQAGALLQHATLQELRRRRGLAAVESSLHMVFTGNPGTGKTTVARLLGRAFLEQGILPGGQVVEVARADLIGEYLGQTAPRVVDAMDSASEGVLLIDEAHGLLTDRRDPYGREALDTLVKGMEDRRTRLAVILCGYPDEMNTLLDSNPGLRSRIARTIHFPDYSAGQLLDIFLSLAWHHDYRLGRGVEQLAAHLFQERVQSGEAARGNARMVRRFFEEAVQRQAARLAGQVTTPTDTDLSTLTVADLGEQPAVRHMSA